MSIHEKTRHAHYLLNDMSSGYQPSEDDLNCLRSFLPELPKQKTLEELRKEVYKAWIASSGDEWVRGSGGSVISLEDWLSELYVQLNGLKDTPAHPALPAGMRLADHAEYGRVVTSPKPDQDGVYVLLMSKPKVETEADWEYAHECELTFIDAEPTKAAHPEFLETEADYHSAPAGTVAGKDGWLVWIKQKNGDWSCDGGSEDESILAQTGKRRVLRWGWSE